MKIIFMLFFAIMLETTLAQENTLISSDEMSNGGFGAPVIKFSEINGQNSLLLGARGGWIINHNIVLGGGMYGLASNVSIDFADDNVTNENSENFHFMYGGFEFEYIISPMEIFHLSVYTLIGLGRLSKNNYDDNDFSDSYYDRHHEGNSFFVAEPAVNLMINVTTFFRFGLGISYRYTSGADYETLTDKSLSGISGMITLKFGTF